MNHPPVTLSIAGSDCSAGAGLQADLKTFQHFRTYGLTVVTCVVAETPATLRSVHAIPPAIVQDQLSLMLEAYPVAAIKTGMLFSKPHVVAVAEILGQHPDIPLVVDPVMVSSTGDSLLQEDAVDAYRDRLLPLASVMTPNLDEAAVLLGRPIPDEGEMEDAARELEKRHGTAVLLKGGHLDGPECADLLVESGSATWFRAPRIVTSASHGTGCTLSAAVTSRLAHGDPLPGAVARAKDYLGETLRHSLTLGDLHHLNQGTTLEL